MHERKVRIGIQFESHDGRFVGYHTMILWLSDPRNAIWQAGEGLTKSLDEAVLVGYRWLMIHWNLKQVQQAHQWMQAGDSEPES